MCLSLSIYIYTYICEGRCKHLYDIGRMYARGTSLSTVLDKALQSHARMRASCAAMELY